MNDQFYSVFTHENLSDLTQCVDPVYSLIPDRPFSTDCNITNGTYKGVGGWKGGGRGGWEAEGRLRLPLRHRQQHCVSSSDTSSHNPQDRPRRSLAAVWHHTHPY